LSQTEVCHIFHGKRSLALLVLGLCEFVRGALLFFILPIYVRGVLGLSTEVVGYAIGGHYTLDTGLRSVAGWCVDRFGERKVVTVCLGIAWIGLWLIVRAHHGPMLVSGCGLLGIGMAAIWPAAISSVTSGLKSSAYGTAMGGIMMAWLIGAGGGAVTMSWFLGDHVRSGFATLLLMWLVSYILAVFIMQGYRSEQHHRRRTSLKAVFHEVRCVRILFPGMFVQMFAVGLLLPVMVLYARYELGFDGKMYSYLLMAGGAATVILQVPMGRLVDRYGYKPFLVGGFILSGIMLPVVVQLRVTWEVFLGVAGFGSAYALVLPSWNSVLARSVTEKRRAVMFGVFMTVEGLGMAIGPLVGTELWNLVGPDAPFYVAACILIVMSIFYSIVHLERLFIQHDGIEASRAS
jgi:MFS transporter, DHA1 family, multidrug resistance protein